LPFYNDLGTAKEKRSKLAPRKDAREARMRQKNSGGRVGIYEFTLGKEKFPSSEE